MSEITAPDTRFSRLLSFLRSPILRLFGGESSEREGRPLTPSSLPAPPGSFLPDRPPTTKTASDTDSVKSRHLSRPKTSATDKEPSSGPLLISCGFHVRFSSRRRFTFSDRSHRLLDPATPLSRNRGSRPDQTPLVDFCNQHKARAHLRTLFPHAGPRFHASCCCLGRSRQRWVIRHRSYPRLAPEVPAAPAGNRRVSVVYWDTRGRLVRLPNTSLSPRVCCSEPEDW